MGGSLSRVVTQFDRLEGRKKLRISMVLCFITVATILLAQFGPAHLRFLRVFRYVGYALIIPTVFCTWNYVRTRGHRPPNQDVNQATVNQQYPPPSEPRDLPPPYPIGPQPSEPSYDNRGTLNNTLPYPDQEGVAPYLPPSPLNPNGSADPLAVGQPPLPAGAPPLYSTLPYPEQQGTEPHLPPPPSYDQAMQASQPSS